MDDKNVGEKAERRPFLDTFRQVLGNRHRFEGAIEKLSEKHLDLIVEVCKKQKEVNAFHARQAEEMREKRVEAIKEIERLMAETGMKLDGSLIDANTSKRVGTGKKRVPKPASGGDG
jgi:DNA-binding protein H-NS